MLFLVLSGFGSRISVPRYIPNGLKFISHCLRLSITQVPDFHLNIPLFGRLEDYILDHNNSDSPSVISMTKKKLDFNLVTEKVSSVTVKYACQGRLVEIRKVPGCYFFDYLNSWFWNDSKTLNLNLTIIIFYKSLSRYIARLSKSS